MNIKIENNSTQKVNVDKLIHHLHSVLESVPPAHLRGISKLILVDRIEDSRLDLAHRAELPGLYHPKMPGTQPFVEIALGTLRSETTWYKRLGRRLTFKANVTATLLSLIGQHYHLTFSHGIKKSQYEAAVRSYTEKQLAAYANSRKGIRAMLLKPFRPALEKLARWLRKKARQETRKHAPPPSAKKPPLQRRRARKRKR